MASSPIIPYARLRRRSGAQCSASQYIRMSSLVSTSLLGLAISQSARVEQNLKHDLGALERVPIPKSLGQFHPSEPIMRSTQVKHNPDRTFEVLKKNLSESWEHIVGRSYYGDPSNRAASVVCKIHYSASKDHATFKSLRIMSGASRARWPEPGFPEQKDWVEFYGADQVWGIRSLGSDRQSLVTETLVLRVNRVTIECNVSGPIPQSKGVRVPFPKDAMDDWHDYVRQVVQLVRKSPLNK